MLSANSPQDAAIRSQLNELRTSGRIIDKGGVEADVVVISQIVRGVNREIVGAVELLAPQYRAKAQELTEEVARTASELSTAFGHGTASLSASLEKEVTRSGASEQLGRLK